jgi:hypothetical protein
VNYKVIFLRLIASNFPVIRRFACRFFCATQRMARFFLKLLPKPLVVETRPVAEGLFVAILSVDVLEE